MRVDIASILRTRAPRLSRWIPRWLVRWVERTLHQQQINHILEAYGDLSPQQFIRACMREWGVTYSVEGLKTLDKNGRYLFASNHPFGGMDGMMLADELIDHFGTARVVVNDLLDHVEPLKPLWVAVNKHGGQSADTVRALQTVLEGDDPLLTFPAGLCSRRVHGRVTDLPWRISFVKHAAASNRAVVPVWVEGELSRFFYRVAALRKLFRLKVNIEMFWLPDEMFSQGGKHFHIRVGRPIPPAELAAQGSWREQAEYVRAKSEELSNK